jgi:hypothetical protein
MAEREQRIVKVYLASLPGMIWFPKSWFVALPVTWLPVLDFTGKGLGDSECQRNPSQLSQETKRPVGRLISTLLGGSITTV